MAIELWDMVSFEYGALAIVAREDRLVRICFEHSLSEASDVVFRLHPESKQESRTLMTNAFKQLEDYLRGQRRHFDLPLNSDSLSAFARRVHGELLKVPYGSVITYGALAARVGSPMAARAVGTVMSSNPFPLVVPCHRVVNADGSIGRYSACQGTRTKRWLIELESGLVGV